jgi:MarR family transcriptional regulator for hemolysin
LRQARFVAAAGMAPTAYRLLQLLDLRDGLSQSDLEAIFEADAAVITRHAKQLEADGYVSRRPDDHDRRFTRVYLTPAGRARIAEVAAAIKTMDAEVWDGVAPADIEAATRALRRARGNLRRNA